MRNIWTVFKTDIKTLSKCFFACAVVIVMLLWPLFALPIVIPGIIPHFSAARPSLPQIPLSVH